MLNPKELRIGNIIATKLNDTGWVAIELNHLIHIIKEGNYYDYKPLSLTPEILEGCGFTRVRDEFSAYYLRGDRFALAIDLHNNFIQIRDEKRTNPLARGIGGLPVPSLHQLQNLYYFLTGKELELNKSLINAQ